METIRNLVESYFGIVSKSIRDIVPKTIMFMMVNKLKDYMTSDLLPMIYSAGDQDNMMEESQDAAKKREEMIHMYHTCKDALVLISDVSSKTGEGGDPVMPHLPEGQWKGRRGEGRESEAEPLIL